MEIEQYIDKKKHFYKFFMNFIEKDVLEESDKEYYQLLPFLESLKSEAESEEIYEALQLISIIMTNHHFTADFFDKIKKIILFLQVKIKTSLTNQQIFDIFQENKRFLLFLFDEKIINVDVSILDFFNAKDDTKSKKYHFYGYCIFFYPEIKDHIDEQARQMIEERAKEIDSNIFENFDQKRHIGENENEVCELIRNDSIEDFVVYVNQYSLSLDSIIKPSVFETNSIFIKHEVTLIEYATFYGAIQIIQYLISNKAELPSSMWVYGIHSNNSEVINLIEESNIIPYKSTYLSCFKIAIKCHHKDLAQYIKNNFLLNEELDDIMNELNNDEMVYGIHYYNYSYYPKELPNDKIFFKYFCKFNCVQLVKLFIKYKDINLNYKIVFKLSNNISKIYYNVFMIIFFK